MTPLEKVEALCDDLVAHYGEAEDREIRAATKLLLVAVARLKAQDKAGWEELVEEYVALARHDPEKFERVLAGNRSVKPGAFLA